MSIDWTEEEVMQRLQDQRRIRPQHHAHGVDHRFTELAKAIQAANLEPEHRNEVLKKILWARNAYVRGVPE